MRISDCSSDVCSSDLAVAPRVITLGYGNIKQAVGSDLVIDTSTPGDIIFIKVASYQCGQEGRIVQGQAAARWNRGTIGQNRPRVANCIKAGIRRVATISKANAEPALPICIPGRAPYRQLVRQFIVNDAKESLGDRPLMVERKRVG